MSLFFIKKKYLPLQYSCKLATATSKPLLVVAFPIADGTGIPCLPISSANDLENKQY